MEGKMRENLGPGLLDSQEGVGAVQGLLVVNGRRLATIDELDQVLNAFRDGNRIEKHLKNRPLILYSRELLDGSRLDRSNSNN